MNEGIVQKITPGDPETHSADVLGENIAQLGALFPEVMAEGRIDFDVLRQLLGGVVEDREEKYGLNWHGKRRARQIALTPSTGTLRPCPDESVDWDTTQNLMIEGDNLEVLKLLQKSYAGKVKLIYIDPPYNTGKDFVYPDDFRDNIKNYLELTGQVDGAGRRLSTNTEASGRFHTDWLNMMYPRLRLARNLLREDGVLVSSIDDVELPNLRRILDEVFGEENFVAVLVWDRNRKNDAKYFSVGHEYMVVCFKDEATLAERQTVFRGPKEGVEEVRALFEQLKRDTDSDWRAVGQGLREFYSTFQDDDPRVPMRRYVKVDDKGPYRDDGNINWPGGGGPRYEVLHPVTHEPCKVPTSGWRYPTPERLWEEVANGRVVFGPDETTVPRIRTNLFENTDQVMISVHYSYAQTSANQFAALFDGRRVFDNPKPVDDIQRLVGYITDKEDLILDFFAGSGTTGHAAMAANAADGGARRHILVQLPEALDADNRDRDEAVALCDRLGVPRTIAEITKERLRRAGAKIRTENPLFVGDTGFRVFKLDSTNIQAWEPQRAGLDETLEGAVEHLKTDRTERDILFELLLKLGLDLCVPIANREIAGKVVHAVGGGALVVCLAPSVGRTDVEELANGIAAWSAELAPAADATCVFRDSAFEDDVAKTNMVAILAQRGLTRVRSL